MHRIEDIIRQLNAVSAHIQPELADHLRQIQERLDRAHAGVARPQHANAPSAALAHVSLAATSVAHVGHSGAEAQDPPILVPASAQAFELLDELEHELDVLEELETQALPAPIADLRLAVDPPTPTLDIRTQIAAQQAVAAVAVAPPRKSPLPRTRPAGADHAVTAPVAITTPPAAEPPIKSAAVASSVTGPVTSPVTGSADIVQPHEPTTPHFLRGNTSPRPATEPSTGSSDPPADRLGQRADIVPLQTTLAAPDSASKLPLFESLWFRQAAPQSFTARIVDRLLQKMPSTVPAVLHFCQDQFSQADSPLICTQIAWELSRRGVGQVLLVDADFDHREISRQLGNVYLPGLSEAINLGEPIDCLVRPTGVQALSWLPSGEGDLSFRKIAGGRLAEISLEFRQRFQWICVHAGAAQDRVTAAWGRFCDYSYLIASMADDLGQPTKQVLEGLRTAECRVSGLITID
jgi:hypothetical protein